MLFSVANCVLNTTIKRGKDDIFLAFDDIFQDHQLFRCHFEVLLNIVLVHFTNSNEVRM